MKIFNLSPWSLLLQLAVAESLYTRDLFMSSKKTLSQLFTIHALANNYMLPCVYALLPNKRQDTYTALFHALLNINPQLAPRSVMIDLGDGFHKCYTRDLP